MDVLRIATAALPPAQRLETFREVFGRKILKFEIEPDLDGSFEADMTLRALPGLGIGTGFISATRNSLTAELIDNDDLILVMLQDGNATIRQRGREETLGNGHAIVTDNGETACFTAHVRTQVTNLRFARKDLTSRLTDPDAGILHLMPQDNQALRLLTSYLRVICNEPPLATADLQRLAVDHIHDLVALALGANRDAAEIARGRGVRIARLQAIKADIIANIASNALSVDAVALRHGVSPRYIRSLFQSEETTFTDFVRKQRLARAHKLLNAGTQSISSVAFEAGFDDLSYFNRSFRRHYGATPSDIRAALRANG